MEPAVALGLQWRSVLSSLTVKETQPSITVEVSNCATSCCCCRPLKIKCESETLERESEWVREGERGREMLIIMWL